MHAHGHRAEEAQHAHAQRGQARAAKPVTPADRILTLQRLAGNAAVSRALEEDEHTHGAGCGHEAPGGPQQALQRRDSLEAAIASPGRPLDAGVRAKAEQVYPMDFGGLLMHDNPVAQRSAQEFGARALTVGPHIIADGPMDEETALHEVDHAFHQAMGFGEGTDDGSGLELSHPDDRFEVKAADNGRKVARGEAPDLSLAGMVAPTPVQRSAAAGPEAEWDGSDDSDG